MGEAELTERDVTAPGFLERYARLCKDASPFLRFLCKAADAPF